MTDALRATLPFVFDDLRLHRLEAACLPHNEPSKAVLAKVGFHEEGLARQYLRINGQWADHLLFALLRADYDALLRAAR
jgi:ribosomal-protein-alanine N-acetyltransferase